MGILGIVRIIIIAGSFYLLYSLGLPIQYLALFAVMAGLVLLFKGRVYSKIDRFIVSKLPFSQKLPPIVRKVLIFIIFLLGYLILKFLLFEMLKMFGVDVQLAIAQSINQSVQSK